MLAALLPGCNTPTPHFHGIEAQRVTVEGSVFDVRIKGRLAEAVRLNPEYAPRLSGIAPRAELAIAQASGCRVHTIRGDATMILAQLAC